MTDNKYKSPWGEKPDDKNKITSLFKNSKPNFSQFKKFNKDFNDKHVILLIAGVISFIWLASGFFIVNEGEKAAVTRFGKFVRTASAGPNYHLPFPIESAIKVNVDHIQKEEIGYRSKTTRGKHIDFVKNAINKTLPEESLMLTGDENILDINFFVQWRVSNLENYLYKVENVKATVKSAAESAMREIIGSTPMALVQTNGRAKAEEEAKALLQKMLDEYKSGVIVENLQLEKVDPPEEVIDAFRDVQTARADKERSINQAEAYKNSIIPKARGEAAKIIQEAEGYRAQIVDKAQGNASRFNSIYKEYLKSKQVTKKRMYLETLESIFGNNNKTLVSNKIGKSAVPYLPLDRLNRGN
ncbi:MAG: FtsH protease activity modulator HflK [Rickettsiales bacterium]